MTEPGAAQRKLPDPKPYDPKSEAGSEPKPEANVRTPTNLTLQPVKRVYQLYHDLGAQRGSGS
jgi:hypothetical protein